MLQCVAACYGVLFKGGHDKVCCSVLKYVVVCCSVFQYVAVCCSVLQCVAVRCSALQCLFGFTYLRMYVWMCTCILHIYILHIYCIYINIV